MINMREEARIKCELHNTLLERVKRETEQAQQNLEYLDEVRKSHAMEKPMTREEELEEVRARS